MQEPMNKGRCCEGLSSRHDVVATLCSYDALLKSKPRDQSTVPQAVPTGLSGLQSQYRRGHKNRKRTCQRMAKGDRVGQLRVNRTKKYETDKSKQKMIKKNKYANQCNACHFLPCIKSPVAPMASTDIECHTVVRHQSLQELGEPHLASQTHCINVLFCPALFVVLYRPRLPLIAPPVASLYCVFSSTVMTFPQTE